MKWFRITPMLLALAACHAPIAKGSQTDSMDSRKLTPTFDQRISKPIPTYDNRNRSLVDAIVDLAFEYQIPTSLEYVDRDAIWRPLQLDLQDTSPRRILEALVAQTPNYRISFSRGIAEVYSPAFRADPSNLFNKVIPDFELKNEDSAMADMDLLCALGRNMMPPVGCGGSHVMGSSVKISLHLRDARVYEILDAIAANRGDVIWTVTIRPENYTRLTQENADAWYVYSLLPGFKEVLLNRLRALFPLPKRP